MIKESCRHDPWSSHCDDFEQLICLVHSLICSRTSKGGRSSPNPLADSCTHSPGQAALISLSVPKTLIPQHSFCRPPSFLFSLLRVSSLPPQKRLTQVNVPAILYSFRRKGSSAYPRLCPPISTHFDFSLFLVPSFPSVFKHVQNFPDLKVKRKKKKKAKCTYTTFACSCCFLPEVKTARFSWGVAPPFLPAALKSGLPPPAPLDQWFCHCQPPGLALTFIVPWPFGIH